VASISSVARLGAMGNLYPHHPPTIPNQNGYALDITELLSLIYSSLILEQVLRQKYLTAPLNCIFGYTMHHWLTVYQSFDNIPWVQVRTHESKKRVSKQAKAS